MYAKLIGGNIQKLRMPIKANGMDTFTNDESIIRANGYKPVVFTDMPSENANPHWEENETEIVQVWELAEGGVSE